MQMLALVLKASVAVLVLATGLKARLEDVAWLWKRPGLLVRSLLAMYVAVPLVAIGMVEILDLPRGTEIAILVLAICAGAPLLPRKLLKFGGDPHYVISLVVATSLLAIVAVPAWLTVIRTWIGSEDIVLPREVAALLFSSFLLPIGAGILIRAVLPGIATRIDDLLLKLATIALGLCAIVLLVALRKDVLALGWPSFLGFAAFALMAIVVGHLLGGPDPSHRTSLAVSCTTRHIGLALLVAAGSPSRRTLALVIAYLLGTIVVGMIYLRWRQKAQGT